jgi:hypothetical protein
MSLQNLASQMQSTGRGGDTMLVHMNPKEVAGLQQLAMAHGGSLTINPQTGLPEAGFLSGILPTILGAALTVGTGGAINPMMAAGIVGAGTGVMTGSLKKGLMAGLGAFSGAGMAPGIMGAGTAAAAVPQSTLAANAVNPAFAPGAAFNQAAQTTGTAMTGAMPQVAATVPGQVAANTVGTAAGYAPAVTGTQAANPAVVGQNAAPSVLSGIGDKFAQAGSGLKNIFTNEGGAGLEFLKNNKMDLLTSVGSALMSPEEEKAKKQKEEAYVFHRWPSNYSRQQLSDRPAGSTSERTYFAATGGMVPGPEEHGTVEQMSQMNQNSVGGNTRYPMASQTTPTYAMPAERPVSQNVIYPATDEPVDAYTGMPTAKMMASGGITSLLSFAPGGSVGFKSKLAAVKAPTKTAPKLADTKKLEAAIAGGKKYGSYEEQTNKYNDLTQQIKDRQADKANRAKELADRQKSYTADLKRMQNEQAARVKELNTEYGEKIKNSNADTQRELKERQADIKNTKDKNEQKQKQADLAAWQKGRAADIAQLNKDKTEAINGAGSDIKNFTNDFNNYKAETTKFYQDVDKQVGTLTKDQATAKQYAGLAKTREGQEKQFEDTKSANQKLIDKANEDYEAATNKYNDYQNAVKDEKAKWEEETKRTTSGIASRGAYATGATGTETAADLQSRIDYINKHPEGTGGMGSTYLTTAQKDQIAKLKDQLTSATNTKKYNPATGQYETDTSKSFQELKAAPGYDTKKKIQEEDNVRQIFEELTGRSPTQDELKQFGFGKNFSDQDVANSITNKKTGLAELNMAAQFSDDDLNDQAKYYWGRAMTKGELAYFKDPANKFTNFNSLRTAMQNNPAYLQNLNKINQAAFSKDQSAAQVAMEGPVTQEQVSSLYQDLFGKPPTAEQLQAALSSGASKSQLMTQLKASPDYAKKMTQPLVPDVQQTAAGVPALNMAPAMTQERMDALLKSYNAAPTGGKQTDAQLGLAPLFNTTGQGGYVFNQPQQQASIEGAMPYQDIINRLGIGGVYQQIADKAPALQPGAQFNVPQGYTPIGQTTLTPDAQATLDAQMKAKAAAAAQQQQTVPMAAGGMAEGGYNLGGYSDGGRLLKGPGDGVSDSIPASIGNRQPARLADGEFVIPARIVSELGNGSTEAGARQLYAMMDRVQKKRRSTVGKNQVAVNSGAHKVLPA